MNAQSAKREWVGGRIVAPFYVTEDSPFRPVIILWLEMPEGVVVHHELIAPGDPELSFGATFLAATAKPCVGPPRRPGTIRVSDPELAEQVRAVAPEIPVVVAPTPEVLDVLEFMMEHPPDEDTIIAPSYLQDGRVSADSVDLLFQVGRRLKKVAPWKSMGDAQLIRVDIPGYGVEAACLSIIGALRESIGLLLFPSLEGYRNFVEAAHRGVTSERTFDVGTSWMSLTFELRRELPATMRSEVARYGWAKRGETRFPVVQHRDSDGTDRPISDDEVTIMTICAGALAEFFTENRDLLTTAGDLEPVCTGYSDPEGVEIRFTYPFEAGEEFEVNTPRSSQSSSQARERASGPGGSGRPGRDEAMRGPAFQGRNDPCLCGSGKKYKRCCLAADRAT